MDNKEKFVEQLGLILMMYSRESVRELKYIKKDSMELVEISYTGGNKRYINITGDSCIAIIKDIYRALS